MRLLILTVSLLLGLAAMAAPVTINFDEPNDIGFTSDGGIGPGGQSFAGGQIGDFQFQSEAFGIAFCTFGPTAQSGITTGNSGSEALVARVVGSACSDLSFDAGITVTHATSLPFALHAADWFGQAPDGSTVQFTGTTAAGDTVTLATPFGTGDWLNLQSFSLTTSGYWDFSQFVVTNEAILELNSITVSVVPIPAAVWLFASGLGLLGWLRRRQVS